MNGVTTAIVGFIFLALAVPSLIKNKTYFYAALVGILVVILLDGAAHAMPSAEAFRAFAYCFGALIQIGAILMLVGSTGGLTMGEIKNELGNMYEVVRRGETEKEVVVPLSEQMKNMQAANANKARRNESGEPKVYTVDEPEPGASPASPPSDSASPRPAPPPPVARSARVPIEKGPLPLD